MKKIAFVKKINPPQLFMSWGLLILLFSVSHAQIKVEELRSTNRDGLQYFYTDVSCSDDHNFTVIGYSYDDKKFPDGYTILVERSNDGGKTWTTQHTGIPNVTSANTDAFLRKVRAIDSLHVAVVGDSGLFYLTTNAGDTWVKQSINTDANIIDVSFSNPQIGMVTTNTSVIYRTTSGGMNWVADSTFFRRHPISCKSFSDQEQSIYIPSFGPLFYTTNAGAKWDSTTKLPDTSSSPNHIIAGSCCFISPNIDFFCGSHIISNRPHAWILLTEDGGKTFQVVLDTLITTNSGIGTVVFNHSNIGIACGGGRGILSSVDSGHHWKIDSIDQKYISSTSASFAGETDVLLTAGGYVLKFHVPDILKVDVFEELRWGSRLYPNPANSWTTLYSNTYYENVTFSVYDALGRKVKDIIPIGKNTKFSVDDLASGTYQLIANFNGNKASAGNLIVVHY
jgi:photosystem II stability/assembly factor-like uncharacterized protein